MPNTGGLLFPIFLGAGLLAPGWLLGRALRAPAGLLGAFLGSAAILLNLILLLDAVDLALTSSHVGLGVAMICLILVFVARLRGNVPEAPHFLRRWREFKWLPYHWLLVSAVVGIVAIGLKATLDPLSGPDTVFRWNFIALQMLREGNLHFYPSVDASDFLHYGWCDGISPLIPNLYFWSYQSLGETRDLATAPVVILQGMLLFQVVYHLAASQGGQAAGCAAAAVLATSSILLSGIAIGQETGMTALSLAAMFWFIEKYRKSAGTGWLVWAGIAAGIGGLAREYGLVFFVLGALRLLRSGLSSGQWLGFLAAVFAVMMPWHLQVWLKTGNPLYSHELLHLFPTNPVYVEYMRFVHGILNFKSNPEAVGALIALLGGLACVPAVTAILEVFRWRQLWPWLTAVLFICIFWIWSAGRTAGGYAYSLRVLTPAIALGSVYGGLLLGRWAKLKYGGLLAALLCLASVDAGERSLFMPYNFSVSWWRERPTAWLGVREQIDWWNQRPYWTELVRAAQGTRILVTDPYTHSFLINRGANPVFYFSPAVRYLFAPDADYQACCARLQQAGIRLILLPPDDPFAIGNRQLSSHRFFSELRKKTPALVTPAMVAYDIAAP